MKITNIFIVIFLDIENTCFKCQEMYNPKYFTSLYLAFNNIFNYEEQVNRKGFLV